MAGSGNTGLTRVIKAFGFSMQGLKAAYQHEEAFRQEVGLLIITFPLALWLGDTGIEKTLLIGSILLLLIDLLRISLSYLVFPYLPFYSLFDKA